MPDFRQTLDQAKFAPEMTNISTTGPNAEGQETTWQNPRDQLTQSSAQELANLLGAKLTSVSMGGPYSNNKPQWQLDFGSGDTQDAAMVYENYQRRPDSFNQQMQDEFKTSQGPSVAAAEFAAGKLGGGHPALPPGVPPPGAVPPPGGTGTGPGPNTWPKTPDPNKPGTDIPVTPLPPPTGVDPVQKVGETVRGGYTVPAKPTVPWDAGGLLRPGAAEVLGPTINPMTVNVQDPLAMPGGLLNPAARMTSGYYKPPPNPNLSGQGLLGLTKTDPVTGLQVPYTPAELAEFGKTGRSPRFDDKNPGFVEP